MYSVKVINIIQYKLLYIYIFYNSMIRKNQASARFTLIKQIIKSEHAVKTDNNNRKRKCKYLTERKWKSRPTEIVILMKI